MTVANPSERWQILWPVSRGGGGGYFSQRREIYRSDWQYRVHEYSLHPDCGQKHLRGRLSLAQTVVGTNYYEQPVCSWESLGGRKYFWHRIASSTGCSAAVMMNNRTRVATSYFVQTSPWGKTVPLSNSHFWVKLSHGISILNHICSLKSLLIPNPKLTFDGIAAHCLSKTSWHGFRNIWVDYSACHLYRAGHQFLWNDCQHTFIGGCNICTRGLWRNVGCDATISLCPWIQQMWSSIGTASILECFHDTPLWEGSDILCWRWHLDIRWRAWAKQEKRALYIEGPKWSSRERKRSIALYGK